jgi:hypothetical protein
MRNALVALQNMPTDNLPPPDSSEIRVIQIGRAIRFSLVGIVVGFSLLSIRASLSINDFHRMFQEMLNGQALPGLTLLVVNNNTLFFLLSVAVPVAAIGMLFSRNVVRSFYVLGFLGFFTFLEFFILYQGLSLPFGQILSTMENVNVR